MTWFQKLKKRVVRYLNKEKASKKAKAKKAKSFDTVRTTAVERELKRSGMSDKMIKRLRGKK